jgi:hypothetical protein
MPTWGEQCAGDWVTRAGRAAAIALAVGLGWVCARAPAASAAPGPNGCAGVAERLRIPVAGGIEELVLSADGSMLAGKVGGAVPARRGSEVRLWNARTGAALGTVPLDGEQPQHLVLSADGKQLFLTSATPRPSPLLARRDPSAYQKAIAGARRALRAIEVATQRPLWKRLDLEGRLELSADGASLLVIDGSLVTAVSTDSGVTLGAVPTNALLDATLVPGAREVVTTSAGGGVERVGLLPPFSRARLREPAHDQTPGRVSASADGRTVVAMNYGRLEAIDLSTGQRRWSYARGDGLKLEHQGGRTLSVHDDGDQGLFLVVHGPDGLAELPLGTASAGTVGLGRQSVATHEGAAVVVRDLDFSRCR